MVNIPNPVPLDRRPLPESNGEPSELQGLYRKYIVARVDGKDQKPTDKHFNCNYFVLDVSHDKHAKPALEAYANSVEATHPMLAAELRARYELPEPPQ